MSEETEGVTLEQLQQMAAEQDRLSGYDEGSHPAEVPTAEIEQRRNVQSQPEPEKPKAEAPEPKPEEPEKPAEPEPQKEAGPPEVPDSSLKSEADSKSTKSEKRLNDSWRKLNDEKSELARQRQELEEVRQSLNDRGKPEEFVDSDVNSAEDYEAAARNFELEGEMRLAEKAREQAEEVRAMAQEHKVSKNEGQFKQEWAANFEEAAKSYPELREGDSTFRKAVNQMLQERPVLATYSGGIIDAADIVANMQKAESANSLQEQINALTEENAGLKSKLSIGGSDPSAPTGDRSFNELTPEEQFAELQRRAAEVDAGGGY